MAKTSTAVQARYDATHTTRISLKLNTMIDADILAKLKAQPSMQGYIKKLIREDIKKESPR